MRHPGRRAWSTAAWISVRRTWLTLRPQVMPPLLPLPQPAGPAALDGLRGAAGLWLMLWPQLRKTPAGEADPVEHDGPLSLRDALSLPEVSDLHQKGDAERHVALMQAAVLNAVEALLERHGTDPEALRDQTTVLAGALTDPESDGFRPALRSAVHSLPALVAGTAVQQTGEALVTAIRHVLG